MQETLIIGDTHFDDKWEDYLPSQINAVKKVIEEYDTDHIVFLGDISDKRKPKPNILLAIDEFFKWTTKKKKVVDVLMGNHDANDKSDDGVTYLSVFNSKYVRVHNVAKEIKVGKRKLGFIPNYENNSKIIEAYRDFCSTSIVFGHFGYIGCLNGVPDYVFGVAPSDILSYTVLGHIHRNNSVNNIECLGTPYPVGFYDSEYNVGCAGVLQYDSEHQDLARVQVMTGPRYYTAKADSLDNLKVDQNNFNVIRVLLDSDSDKYGPDIIKFLIETYGFKWVDLRVVPKITKMEYKDTKRIKTMVDKSMLDQFLEKIQLPYPKDELMAIYNKVKNEN
jgi:DNA repair exonuclease SbcCD nuclease subunit